MSDKEIKLNQRELEILIPDCCREGWPDCPHIAKKPKKKKRNIGL